MSEISQFYDEFAEQQKSTGINNRHISILEHLTKLGLKPYHNVLEVGCGVGTVSELILTPESVKANIIFSGFLSLGIGEKSLKK